MSGRDWTKMLKAAQIAVGLERDLACARISDPSPTAQKLCRISGDVCDSLAWRQALAQRRGGTAPCASKRSRAYLPGSTS
jgi:hypothetical protein